MKKLVFIFCLFLGWIQIAFGQSQFIQFHHNTSVDTYELNNGDSIYFDATHQTLFFLNDATVHSLLVEDVDSITFLNDLSKNVYIHYEGNSATVTNPLSADGVSVTVEGAGITVQSTSSEKDINYILSGTSTNGFFKVYSDYRYNVLFNGVTLTNPIGPAVNLQSKKRGTLHLINGTFSTLSDGQNYDVAPVTNGVLEDQKGTLFSEGNVTFIGGGSLNVIGQGSDQHGIASDETIEVHQGQISVSSEGKDGIHGSEGFVMNGGKITIDNVKKDGIDGENGAIEINCGVIQITSTSADQKAIKCDKTFTMNGGKITLIQSGNESQGIKSGQRLTINGGKITATNSGNPVLVESGAGYDPSYVKILNSDGNIVINGGVLDLKTTGISGRTISGKNNVIITGGEVTLTATGDGATYTDTDGNANAHHSTTIKAHADIVIKDGVLNIMNSGTGGDGLNSNASILIGEVSTNPTVTIQTTGENITISSGSDYSGARAMKADNSVTIHSGSIEVNSADLGIRAREAITINGGDLSLTATDDVLKVKPNSGNSGLLKITDGYLVVDAKSGDGLDINGDIEVTGGTTIIQGPQSTTKSALKYSGTATISGGTLVASEPSQQATQGFTASSSQNSLILKTNNPLNANTLIHVQDSDGNKLFTFAPFKEATTLIFSSPDLVNGSYEIYTSGTDSGTEKDGYYTGGTYTPGTFKTSFTVSSTVTTVNF